MAKMEFENLSARLAGVFKRLRGKGKLSEKDVEEALREVRLSLLEADVNFKVVREFIAAVKEKSLSQEVLDSLTPAQQVIKIVNDELVHLLGTRAKPLDLSETRLPCWLCSGSKAQARLSAAGSWPSTSRRAVAGSCLCHAMCIVRLPSDNLRSWRKSRSGLLHNGYRYRSCRYRQAGYERRAPPPTTS